MCRRGLTLIDVVVGVSIITLVFFALFSAFKLSIELVYSTKAKIGAVALISERMEYIRSLPYSAVGTVGGIPDGNIPQLEQMLLNGTTYTIRTLIQYTDAPEDGLDDLDDNGVTADYKTVKVEALWNVHGESRSTFIVSFITPVGLETLAGGGTLRVKVFDAVATPVQTASVRVVNNSVVPVIDVTAQTNTNGTVSFPGAPEATDYEIYVSKSGYSSAQTYGVTAQNPNPSPTHVSVTEDDTTTVSFAIDVLGTLKFYSYEPPTPGSFIDGFLNQSFLSALASTTVNASSLVLLDDGSGAYETGGGASSTSIQPSKLVSWDEVSFASSTPVGTSAIVQLYYFDGSHYVLVPDVDLPGNSTGILEGTTDISSLAIATYSSLQLGVTFSSDGTATPEILNWSVSYISGPNLLPNVALDIVGSKTVGTTAGGLPIYKYGDSFTTDSSSQWILNNLEWDVYTLSLPTSSFDITEVCPRTLTVLPGVQTDVDVTVTPGTAHSLHIAVESSGASISGAQVELVYASTNLADNTSACGQVYFGSLTQNTYTVTVTKTGYVPYSQNVDVSGDTSLVVSLVPN